MFVTVMMNRDDLENYFVTKKFKNKDNLTFNVETFKYLSDFNKLLTHYNTADVLFVDDDPIIRSLFVNKSKKIIIKKNKDDKGRQLFYKTLTSSTELFKDIISYKNSYGVIIIDQNLGPDSNTGMECCLTLRKEGYEGAIILTTGDSRAWDILDNVKQSGANGLLIKTKNGYFKKMGDIISRLTFRNFSPKV